MKRLTLLVAGVLIGIVCTLALQKTQAEAVQAQSPPPQPQSLTLVAACDDDTHAARKLPGLWELALDKLSAHRITPASIELSFLPKTEHDGRAAMYRITLGKPSDRIFTLQDWDWADLAILEDKRLQFTEMRVDPFTGPMKTRPMPFLVVEEDNQPKP